jgi:septal ring factor EnvC (AmiA/AmiB activator)
LPASSSAKADDAPNFPPAVKTSSKAVDKTLALPCSGEARYLDGKIDGIMILTERGVGAKAVTGGKVVSAGPFRGYGQVVVVQSKNGYIYFYGGNDSIAVKVGDAVSVGQELGKVGWDAKVGSAAAYFFVFKGGQSLDPAKAPRG